MEKIYVSFHIGRGGHFNNQGHLSFRGEENFPELIRRCADSCEIISEDEDGNPLPDSEWKLTDNVGNVMLEGREEIEAMTGRLEWDGIYDTDYVDTTDNLNDNELDAIWKAYKNEEYMSDELKDAICDSMGYKRAKNISVYPACIDVAYQDGVLHFHTDEREMSEEEWKEHLEDYGFCPVSVEEIIFKMSMHGIC